MVYRAADSEHLAASEAAIRELCRELVPPRSQAAGRPVHLRVGHFEHGSMLSHNLHGFTILSILRDEVADVDNPGLDELPPDFAERRLSDWCTPGEVTALLEPTAMELSATMSTDPEHPLISAIVANLDLDEQIHAALRAVATLVRRTEVVDRFNREGGIENLSPAAKEADRMADATLRDAIRGQGWRATARQLMSQASLQDIRLLVSYEAPLLTQEEVRRRAPLARFAYNTLSPARELVDRTAAAVSQGMRVTGHSNLATFRVAENFNDETQLKRFLAHMMRDGFVCGNGLIYWGEDPTDVRLARPEQIESVDLARSRAHLARGAERTTVRNILYAGGSSQMGSNLGASILEPFIQIASDRALFLRQFLTAGILRSAPSARKHAQLQSKAKEMDSVATEQLSRLEEATRQAVGSVPDTLLPPPSDLYFPGNERMRPVVSSVILAERVGEIRSSNGESKETGGSRL